jgi:Polyketide cyclase / dehydrase and lipid transport
MAKDKEYIICAPSPGFDYCFEVTVFIAGKPEELWNFLGDMEKMSDFFPSLEFRRDQGGPLQVGETYFSKLSFQKNWTGYEVLIAQENQRLSARQVGPYLFIKSMQYDHKLIPVQGGTLSQEKIEYSLYGGIFKPLLNALLAGRMLRGVNLSAHHELKKRVEQK